VDPVLTPVSAGILAALLVVPPLLAQSPVPVHREPKHRLVWEEGPLRVLDVRIAPGDTTLFHVHDTPMLAVRIAVSRVDVQTFGGPWSGVGPADTTNFYPGAIDPDTSYGLRPVTHRVTNAGQSAFHLIGITHAGPGVAAGQGTSGDVSGTLEHTSRWFLASRLAIPAGSRGEWLSASTPLVIVQIGTSRVQVELAAGAPTLLDGPAALAHLPAGSRYRLRNTGAAPATLVVVAVR
jgi:hypothetical protein